MSRRFLSILLVSLSLSTLLLPLSAQENAPPLVPPPAERSLTPSPCFVGDRVLLRLHLDVPEHADLRVPDPLPALSWGVVRKIEIVPPPGGTGYDVTILFTPYRTGAQSFPPIDLGPFRLDRIPVLVSALLEEDQEVPQPIREQLMIPSMANLLIPAAGILLVLPLIYLLWTRTIRTTLRILWERLRGRFSYRQVLRKLYHLERRVAEMEPKTFYSTLQASVRDYLSRRWNPGIVAYTTTEIGLYMETEGLVGAGGALLLEVFHRGDEVKFAGSQVDTSVLRSDLVRIRQALGEMERTFWDRRRRGER
ncbi:MAG: hypothetical protein Kow009_01160 [Spirochaetales bacterium]